MGVKKIIAVMLIMVMLVSMFPVGVSAEGNPPAPTLALAEDTGVTTDYITSNGTVNIGNLQAEATWEYSINSGTSWNTGSGTSFVLSNGTYNAGTIQVHQTLNGNTSDAASNGNTIEIAKNQINNGDFQQGNTGFSTSYTYNKRDGSNLLDAGGYHVVNRAIDVHSSWTNAYDHTNTVDEDLTAATGKYFVANGSGDTTHVVWQSNAGIKVDAGVAYRFEAYLMSLYADDGGGASYPDLKFQLTDGTHWADMGTSNVTWGSNDKGNWYLTFADGTFSTEGTYYIRLVNNQSGAYGNDLGVDDIYFGIRGAAPSAKDPDTNPTGEPTVFDTSEFLSMELVTDTGASATDNITSDGQVNVTGLQYAWQYSTNNGSDWTNGAGSSFTLNGDGAKSVIARQRNSADTDWLPACAPLEFTLDTTAPDLDTAVVVNNTLTLTYSEDLDSNHPPVATDFAVAIDGGDPSVPTALNVSGDTITLTLTSSVYNGQTVTVSYTAPVGNQAIQDIAGNKASNLNGQAVTNNTITITYDANEATGGTVPSPQNKVSGVDLTLATNSGNLVRDGYTFAGWNTQSDGNGTDYAKGGTYTTDNSQILYAKWTINQYTVTFEDYNGAELKTETVNHGGSATAPANPTREGYTFTGWDIAFDNVTSDLTVTAQYSVNQYQISFESNGGSVVDAITADYGTTITASEAPSREGYGFGGWYKEAGLENAWNFGTDTVPAENITLYAKWTITDEEAVAKDLADVEIGYAEGDNAEHVTQDIILPASGTYGSTVTWTSSDPSIVTVTGEVYRPTFTVGDEQVTVTASVYKGTVTDTKDFILTVIKQPATDEEAVTIDIANLTIGYEPGDYAEHVTQNIILKTSGNSGTTITWASSDPSVITESGEVYRPTFTAGDAELTVTGTVYKGNVIATKDFYLKVIKLPMNDAEKVAADKDKVEIIYADGDSANSVTRNVILPTVGDNGSTVTWSSSNPSLIATDGTVTRPSSGNMTVTLTTTITSGSESNTKEFILTVKAKPKKDKDEEPVTEEITVDVEAGQGETVSKAKIERTTEADGTIKDEVTLEQDDAEETVNKLKELGQDTARIVIPDAEDQVSEVKVTVPEESIDLLTDGNINLEIYTENGRIIVPADSLSKLNEDLYFRVVPIKDEKQKNEVIDRAKKDEMVKEVTKDSKIEVLGRPMTIETNMESQPVIIVLPLYDRLPDNQAEREKILNNLVIFIEHDDGTMELVKGTVTNYYDPNTMGIEFGIEKFSTFTMVYMEGWKEYLTMQNPHHEAYIMGYPDGTFRPDRAITRAEVAALLARNMTVEINESATKTFPDLSQFHWAYADIQEVVQAGLIQGYTDRTFRPDDKITRAEMATIAARWKKLQDKQTSSFKDIANHWAKGKIAALEDSGLINGYPDGTFKPDKELSRAEAVKIINRLLERGPLHGVSNQIWPDVTSGHWAFEEIEEASVDHYFRLEEETEYLVE